MEQLALKQATIEYRQFGPQDSAHPPVFFVHGILVDGKLWTDVAEDLGRRGYRCIVPTLPLGSHTIPVNERGSLSLPGVAQIVHDAIVALDLSDVTLVGSNTGGGICQLVVDAHPERIGRLVLTNCDAFDKCPPFPFDTVFGLLRGPLSIRAMFRPMRLNALRRSPLGFGLGDRVFTPSLGRRLAEVFSNGTLIEVPGAKTFVSLDNPNAVIDAIAA